MYTNSFIKSNRYFNIFFQRNINSRNTKIFNFLTITTQIFASFTHKIHKYPLYTTANVVYISLINDSDSVYDFLTAFQYFHICWKTVLASYHTKRSYLQQIKTIPHWLDNLSYLTMHRPLLMILSVLNVSELDWNIFHKMLKQLISPYLLFISIRFLTFKQIIQI